MPWSRATQGGEFARAVPALTNATSIASGYSASYGIVDGGVWAWGRNDNGQLGDGTTTSTGVPVRVSGLSDVTQVAADEFSASALRTDGSVWVWGSNRQGELGDGSPSGDDQLQPKQLLGLPRITAIAHGNRMGFALADDGTVWSWGRNHHRGADGNEIFSPTQVEGLDHVIQIASHDYHAGAYALRDDGSVWAWGYQGPWGELGDGTPWDAVAPYQLTPVQVKGLPRIRSVAAGGDSGFAIAESDGTVWAWGRNENGDLGDGTLENRPLPVHLTELGPVLTVAGRTAGALALRPDHTVATWGNGYTAWNWTGGDVLGRGPAVTGYVTHPVTVTGLKGVSAVFGGDFAGFALGGKLVLGPGARNEHTGGVNPAELNHCAACAGDPVDLATGDFFESVEDFVVTGRGPDLAFSRTYDTRRAGNGGRLGYGWTDSYDWSLTADTSDTITGGTVTIRQLNGSQVVFTPDGRGNYWAPSRVLARLVRNDDGTWTYTLRRRTRYTFSASGRLTSITDLNGDATTLTYDSAGLLSTVTDPAGRSLAFTYDDANRVTKVTDPLPRSVAYTYDAAGNLATATDADGRVWTYGYDGNHRLTTVEDPRGNTVTNTYDDAGRVSAQQDRAGRTMTFAYAQGEASGATTTTVTHPRGNKDVYTYADARLVSLTQGSGSDEASTTTYAYDDATNGLTSVTDGRGKTSTATYDAHGNRLTATDPLGRTTTWTYNAFDEPLSVKDPLGVTTSWTYDDKGNALSASRPLTGADPVRTATTTYTYADTSHPGDVTAVTDPLGKVTSLTYDAAGNVTASTDATGRTTSYTYNAIGWRTSTVLPSGHASGATASEHTVGYGDFTGFGRPKTVTDPLGHQTRYAFDADQNLTDVTDADGRHVHTDYDANGRPVKVTRPDESTRQSGYDDNGNLTSQTDGLGHATTYGYDALDRRTSVKDGLGRTTSYGYDKAGNLTTVTAPGDLVTTRSFDDAGQLTSVDYSDAPTHDVTYTYDDDGRRLTMADGTGTTRYSYDSLNRLTQVVNGAGATVAYGYDLAGRPTTIDYPGDTGTVTRGYDDAGRLTSVRDWLGKTTTFEYDADGGLSTLTYPNGVTGRRTYDRADRLTGITYGTDAASLASFAYTRTDAGLLASAMPGGGATGGDDAYAYTANGQLKSTGGAQGTATWAYDAADRLARLPDGTTLAYDDADQLTTLTPTEGAATTFAFDARGNRTTATTGSSDPARYTYDQANRLTAFISPSGESTSYAYDGDGLRASKTTAGAAAKAMSWDLVTGSVPLLLSDGASTYVYGPGNAPLEQVTGTSVSYLHGDQLQSTKLLTDADGTAVGRYDHDPYGKVTSHTGNATPLQFNGQYADAESGLVYLRARYYDPATGQFMSVDPLAGMTRARYSYASGNPLSFSDPSGLLDWGDALAIGIGVGVGLGIGACIVLEPCGLVAGGGLVVAGAGGGAVTAGGIALVGAEGAAAAGALGGAAAGAGSYIWYNQPDDGTDASDCPPARSLDDPSSLKGATEQEVRDLIPGDWKELPLKKGDGSRFLPPRNNGDSISIERGWPGHSDPVHSGPYVKIARNGTVTRIPLAGNPALGG